MLLMSGSMADYEEKYPFSSFPGNRKTPKTTRCRSGAFSFLCQAFPITQGGRLKAGRQKKEVPVSSSDVSIEGVGVGILDDFPAV